PGPAKPSTTRETARRGRTGKSGRGRVAGGVETGPIVTGTTAADASIRVAASQERTGSEIHAIDCATRVDGPQRPCVAWQNVLGHWRSQQVDRGVPEGTCTSRARAGKLD